MSAQYRSMNIKSQRIDKRMLGASQEQPMLMPSQSRQIKQKDLFLQKIQAQIAQIPGKL